MLQASQRQNADYTLTSRLMGDPRPDRWELSHTLRQRVKVTGTTPDYRPQRSSPVLRIHYALRAIENGYTSVRAIADELGVKHSSAGLYARELVERDWAVSKMIITKSAKMNVYEVTDLGRRELKKIGKLL